MMKKIKTLLFGLLIIISSCTSKPVNSSTSDSLAADSDSAFSFAFLTDAHLNRSNNGNGDQGLKMALEDVKSKGADFVIFGGDNTDVDALKPEDEATVDSLMARFKTITEGSGLKTYYTIGNHDRFYTLNGQLDKDGFGMFIKHFGETTYSFNYKGVHFIVLNSVQRDDSNTYLVNEDQFKWLQADLDTTGKETPIVVSTHVPFQSLYYPAVEGRILSIDMLDNFKQVWDLLLDYNIQIVLQGHQHLHEELFVKDTWFLTGGAVSASWWGGEFHRTQEGYLLVKVDADKKFTWDYIDYGWGVKK